MRRAGVPSGSSLQQLLSQTRHTAVADALRRALLLGEIAPGERLREVQIASSLGVSRPTLREAIQELVHEGFLVHEPYKGVRVVEMDAEGIRDIASVRTKLETLAAIKTSSDASGGALEQLRQQLKSYIWTLGRGDRVETHLAHVALHGSIWMNSGSPMLERLWPIVAAPISIAVTLDESLRPNLERDERLHVALVDAIVAGDEDEISRQVALHVEQSANELIKLVSKRGGRGKGAARRKTPGGGV